MWVHTKHFFLEAYTKHLIWETGWGEAKGNLLLNVELSVILIFNLVNVLCKYTVHVLCHEYFKLCTPFDL